MAKLTTKETFTLLKAIELSVVKWAYVILNNGSDVGLIKAHPELANLRSYCGLCQYHINDNNKETDCSRCPVVTKKRYSCYYSESFYQRWVNINEEILFSPTSPTDPKQVRLADLLVIERFNFSVEILRMLISIYQQHKNSDKSPPISQDKVN